MAKQRWEVHGDLSFNPQLPSFKFPTHALPGVRVRVSAKESELDPDWQVWGEGVTDSEGKFSIINQKDKSKRRSRVEVRFENDEYGVYEKEKRIDQVLENMIVACTPGALTFAFVQAVESHLTKQNLEANWITIHKDDSKSEEKGPGKVEIRNLVFQKGGREGLGDDTYRKHAEIWWILRRVEEELGGLTGTGRVGVKYPHHNKLFGLGIAANLGLGGLSQFNRNSETAYANPMNNVAYIIGNTQGERGKDDFFDISTLIHEVAHLWAHEHSTGEDALAPYLLMHGSTHAGKQNKSHVAFHEAFA